MLNHCLEPQVQSSDAFLAGNSLDASSSFSCKLQAMVANVGQLPRGFGKSQSERTKSFSWKAPSKDIESNGTAQIRNQNGSLSAQCHLVGSIKLLPFNFQHLLFIVFFYAACVSKSSIAVI